MRKVFRSIRENSSFYEIDEKGVSFGSTELILLRKKWGRRFVRFHRTDPFTKTNFKKNCRNLINILSRKSHEFTGTSIIFLLNKFATQATIFSLVRQLYICSKENIEFTE